MKSGTRWAADPRLILPLMFLAWATWGFYVAHPSLNTSWFYDDLHLIRPYTPVELASTWVGHWDVDLIETPGYRPLTTHFNHLRATLFGENVLLHRLFIIFLFAACLTTLSLIVTYFGVSHWQSFLAGLLTISHQHNWYNLVWVSDGVHALNTLLGLLAILFFLQYLRYSSFLRGVLSLSFALMGLLIREDTIALLVISLFLGVASLYLHAPSEVRSNPLRDQPFMRYTFALIAIVALYFIVRALAIGNLPAAPSLPLIERPVSWLRMFTRAVSPFGQLGIRLTGISFAWFIIPSLLIVLIGFAASQRDRLLTCFFLMAVVIGTSIGLENARSNLLLSATSFLSIALVIAMTSVARRSPASAVLAVILFLSILTTSTIRSRIAQHIVQPNSVAALYLNGQFLLGQHSRATIPEARRQTELEQFTRYDILIYDDYLRVLPELVAEAQSANRLHPTPDGKPFIPQILLNGTEWLPTPAD